MRVPRRSPFIIPVFLAHQGCPHRCVFCNQQVITGRGGEAEGCTAARVAATIREHLSWKREGDGRLTQVAFYGGSFTALPADYQERLLGAVQPYLAQGLVHEIRLSTRPDGVDQPRLDLLKRYGVRTVELGAQSMDDGVLALSGRGHTAQDTVAAVSALKKNGLTTGIQLMLGLPGDTRAKLRKSAGCVRELRPDFVRLYPTLVLRGTRLAGMYEAGGYRPLTLGRAVALAGMVKEVFDAAGISVVRMGLQHEAALVEDLLAGPYHPAFGELVLSRIFYRKVRARLLRSQDGGKKVLWLSARDQSLFRGPANCNVRQLERRGLLQNVEYRFDPDQPRNSVLISGG